MEIGPVSAVRMVPMVRSRETALAPPGVFEVEYTSRAGDEAYVPTVTRAASGAEEDDREELEDDAEAEPWALAAVRRQQRQISYFA